MHGKHAVEEMQPLIFLTEYYSAALSQNTTSLLTTTLDVFQTQSQSSDQEDWCDVHTHVAKRQNATAAQENKNKKKKTKLTSDWDDRDFYCYLWAWIIVKISLCLGKFLPWPFLLSRFQPHNLGQLCQDRARNTMNGILIIVGHAVNSAIYTHKRDEIMREKVWMEAGFRKEGKKVTSFTFPFVRGKPPRLVRVLMQFTFYLLLIM